MKRASRLRARRVAVRRWSIVISVVVLAIATAIAILTYLGLYLRFCMFASSLLSLFGLCYAFWTLRYIRQDNARMQREITIAKMRLSVRMPPISSPRRRKEGPASDRTKD